MSIQNATKINKINDLRQSDFCAAKGCTKKATTRSKIILIDKEAVFCESCRDCLEKSGLIENTNEDF